MTDSQTELEAVRAALAQIVELASQVARAGGAQSALRNRALEIAALAENLRWCVDPDAAGWLVDSYDEPTAA
jgi:hypothetical protein